MVINLLIRAWAKTERNKAAKPRIRTCRCQADINIVRQSPGPSPSVSSVYSIYPSPLGTGGLTPFGFRTGGSTRSTFLILLEPRPVSTLFPSALPRVYFRARLGRTWTSRFILNFKGSISRTRLFRHQLIVSCRRYVEYLNISTVNRLVWVMSAVASSSTSPGDITLTVDKSTKAALF